MRKKAEKGVSENFLMYFSSIIAVFLISSIMFGGGTFTGAVSPTVQLSSGLFVILALSMFLYVAVRIRGVKA